MMRKIGSARSGFTLLEVMLALTIGVVLLAAIYLALWIQYHQTRAGREVLEEASVVRGILNRITSDVNGNLGPVNPYLYQLGAYSGNWGPGTNPSSSSGSSSGSSGATTTATSNTFNFNLGVQGDDTSLVLTVSRVPSEVTPFIGGNQPQGQTPPAGVSDLRRTTYWLIGAGDGTDETKGLARQEVSAISGPDAATVEVPPTNIDNPESFIIAHQVKTLKIEYFDGTTWQQSWDGTTLDATSQLPIGPPAAIAFTITMVLPSANKNATREVTVRHVVPIQAANRWVTAQPPNP